jgi:hypothetical protein
MQLLINMSDYDLEYIRNMYDIPKDISVSIAEALLNGREIPPNARLIDANMIEYENWYLEETGESYKMVCKDDIDGMSAIIEAEGEIE